MDIAADGPKRRIVISGASGLIGSAASTHFSQHGWHVQHLIRRESLAGRDSIHWDPAAGTIDAPSLEGAEAVVHLAGLNLSAKRWTKEFKGLLRSSRVEGTRTLCEALASLSRPPNVLISASAVGYYGDRGAEELTEDSDPGEGFLPELCLAWEAATGAASDAGIRVVHLRIGPVLSADGGALAKLLPPFRIGLGGPLGSGDQFMSWVHIRDIVGIVGHAIGADLSGPVNATAPHPVCSADFARTLGQVLRRPAFLRMPTAAVLAVFGEMGRDLLLSSARALPARLSDTGYEFQFPCLRQALESLLTDQASSTRRLTPM